VVSAFLLMQLCGLELELSKVVCALYMWTRTAGAPVR